MTEGEGGGRPGPAIGAAGTPTCQCPRCQQGVAHADREWHQQMALFASRLDERQRRWYAALEADRVGQGGDRLLAQIVGVDEKTIRRGRAELAASLADVPVRRARAAGAADRRWATTARKKDPVIVTTLQALVEPQTAGDPMTGQRWVRRSLRHLSDDLGKAGHPASPPTVGRLLRALDYGLHANAKQVEAASHHPDRDAQFTHIAAQRQAFQEAGWPVVSVDTKKKELVGAFRNAGVAWRHAPEAVNAHDFPQDALGRAVPYGLYDLRHNRGAVYVGTSADTPRFAVDVLARWWEEVGRATYPVADRLLLLADAGGSNSCRARLWKHQLQVALCDRFGLTVTVCHYPTGCSKYNPVEHRLFGPISSNWAAQPLRTWDTLLACIRGTTTTTGLTVQAMLHDQPYVTGERVTKAAMATLALERHAVCPVWNYTLRPRPAPPNREVIS